MARTWSYRKQPAETLSAAQRARLGRPSGLTAFLIAIVAVSIFFLGLTLYSAFTALRHPMTEIHQAASDTPRDE